MSSNFDSEAARAELHHLIMAAFCNVLHASRLPPMTVMSLWPRQRSDQSTGRLPASTATIHVPVAGSRILPPISKPFRRHWRQPRGYRLSDDSVSTPVQRPLRLRKGVAGGLVLACCRSKTVTSEGLRLRRHFLLALCEAFPASDVCIVEASSSPCGRSQAQLAQSRIQLQRDGWCLHGEDHGNEGRRFRALCTADEKPCRLIVRYREKSVPRGCSSIDPVLG